MSVHPGIAAHPARSGTLAREARLRRGSLAILVLLVVESGIGTYVGLYVTVPRGDHGGGLGRAISGGPPVLAGHALLGLLLGLGALSVLAQAVLARRWRLTVLMAAGLLAMAFASVTGASFVSTGDPADSMAMSVMTDVALLCYAASLYALPRTGR
jgi:hypothetical protein